jgi:hypothetical protein
VLKTTAPADGEGVWFWLPDAGVKFGAADDGGKKARSPEEHEISRKPLRGECRVIPV